MVARTFYKRLSIGLVCTFLCFPAFQANSQEKQINTVPLKVKVVRAFDHFQVARPINILHANDGSGKLYIGSQLGQIQVLSSTTSKEEPTDFLDISDRVTYKDKENEEGLLGLVFHPQFKTNGQLFACYNSSTEPHMIFVSRFHRSKKDPSVMDKDSEEVILKIKKPFWNHNGGTILFGPDNYLYLAMGDGGMGFDPLLSAQDPTTILGKILRIDVDHRSPGRAYAIPADNPFVNVPGARPEIYALGLRNVWRMSFDKKTGALIAADVGQDLWEEINIITRGGNYGWSIREATHPFVNEKFQSPITKISDPVWEYPHNEEWGKSITGGSVYYGKNVPELQGYYVYGDYVSGKLWALKWDPKTMTATENRPIAWDAHLPIVTFGEDEQGEIFFSTTTSGGMIYTFTSDK